MYKRPILCTLKKKLGYEYKGKIEAGKFSDVVLLKMPSGEKTAGKIVSGDRIKKNEIQYWPLLEHKNVVELRNTIMMPEFSACCFVMNREYMSLEKIVKTGWFKNDENGIFDIKRWLLDSLYGVEYLHSHNLCHLNITASNIFVSYDSKAKLGGFRFISSSTQPISECGYEFPYYPPELCYSRGTNVLVDPVGVDLWSLGITTLRLFTKNILKGELGDNMTPWSKDVYKTLFKEIQELDWHIDYTFPEMDISELDLKRLKNFIKMFLALKPQDRPSAAQAKMHKFLCSGLYMPKPDAVWKKKASCVTIEMIVEQNNTVENVKERCEGRAVTNSLMLPLRPHKKHQLIELFKSSDAKFLEENVDSKENGDFKPENQHNIEGKSLAIYSVDKVGAGDGVETPVLEECFGARELYPEKFKASSNGEKCNVIQKIADEKYSEKPGSGQKRKKAGFFSRTKFWILEKCRLRKNHN